MDRPLGFNFSVITAKVSAQAPSMSDDCSVLRTSLMSNGNELIYRLMICVFNGYMSFEPRFEKTGLRGFRPGPTQTRLYNHTRWLKA